MENNKLNNTVDQFLNPKQVKSMSQDGMEREECEDELEECELELEDLLNSDTFFLVSGFFIGLFNFIFSEIFSLVDSFMITIIFRRQ